MNHINQTNSECIDVCNELLRGERSAVEAYDIAIKKFSDEPKLNELSNIRNEHAVAIGILEVNIRSMRGEPDDDSGAWGTTVKMIQHTASFFGAESAIEALQNGEKHGVDLYTKALSDGHVLPECKEMIRAELLPRVNRHIVTLERLEELVD
ncbi:hypothetical protein NT6N_27880 [Oceaniferula spumae]|uniref:DUF2383 domain-containing protein n=1 Tax=Oceaniferula spumae TaxID=2979115 RepID=A0AAT9FP39_9BACT